jgi:hypothetical protein
MFGLQYNWLLSARGMSVRLARGGLITLAVGAFCLACVLAPSTASLSRIAAVSAPTAVSLKENTDAELPYMLIRLWILVPRLLPPR